MSKASASVIDNLNAKFGNVIDSAKCIFDSKDVIIEVSPRIDFALNGGIPEGSFVVLAGPPKCGKSTLSLDFAATAQSVPCSLNGQPRMVFYLNVEGRIKKRDLKGIPHLNTSPERFQIVESKPGNILNAESFLEIGAHLLEAYPGCVLIVDSFSLLSTDAEMTKSMDQMQRADGAKLLAKFCRKAAQVVPVNKNIVIGINHMMGNPTGYGPAMQEKGGQATKYQTDIKLIAKSFKFIAVGGKEGEDGEEVKGKPIGQIVEWYVSCSALGPPGQTFTSYIRFGEGIDKASELATLAADLGIINKAASWYSYDGHKFQGLENLRAGLLANPELYNKVKQNLKDMLG